MGVAAKRRQFIADHGARCMRCGSRDDLTVDHIVPKSLGGPNTHENLQVLCRRCNQAKADQVYDYRFGKYGRVAKDAGMALLGKFRWEAEQKARKDVDSI